MAEKLSCILGTDRGTNAWVSGPRKQPHSSQTWVLYCSGNKLMCQTTQTINSSTDASNNIATLRHQTAIRQPETLRLISTLAPSIVRKSTPVDPLCCRLPPHFRSPRGGRGGGRRDVSRQTIEHPLRAYGAEPSTG